MIEDIMYLKLQGHFSFRAFLVVSLLNISLFIIELYSFSTSRILIIGKSSSLNLQWTKFYSGDQPTDISIHVVLTKYIKKEEFAEVFELASSPLLKYYYFNPQVLSRQIYYIILNIIVQ